jgi:hypothetical protein
MTSRSPCGIPVEDSAVIANRIQMYVLCGLDLLSQHDVQAFKENHYTALLEGTNSNICLCCLHARKLILLFVVSISSSYNTNVREVSITYCYGYMSWAYATSILVTYILLH